MIEKSDFRWRPQDIAEMPITQLMAIWAPVAQTTVDQRDALKRINEIRAARGWPPLTRLIGKGK